MTKSEQIEAKLAEPIKVGDTVDIRIPYMRTSVEGKGKKAKTVENHLLTNISGSIKEIIDHPIHGLVYDVDTHSISIPLEALLEHSFLDKKLVKAQFVTHDISGCGANPFKPRVKVNFIATTISGLLFRGDYGKGRGPKSFDEPIYDVVLGNHPSDDAEITGKTYGGINFNPYILDKDGNKQYYQRDLVWTTEQKRLLIHSIYNGIEIGKFIFKQNSWKELTKQMKETGHGYNYECVDGKQRFHAILEFVQGKFCDEFGNYWNDLSATAKHRLSNYGNLALGELDEDAGANEIVSTFLTLNFTGTPMSKEHIEFVQSIKL